MRRLLESLVPDHCGLYWGRVGGMFAFYLVLTVTAASVYVNHESSPSLARQPAATVAIDCEHHAAQF